MTASLGGLMPHGYGIDAIDAQLKRQGGFYVERSEYKTALAQTTLITALGLGRSQS